MGTQLGEMKGLLVVSTHTLRPAEAYSGLERSSVIHLSCTLLQSAALRATASYCELLRATPSYSELLRGNHRAHLAHREQQPVSHERCGGLGPSHKQVEVVRVHRLRQHVLGGMRDM